MSFNKPSTPNVIKTVIGVWNELSPAIAMLAVIDPMDIATAKSKNVICDIAFLPNTRVTIRIKTNAATERNIASSMLFSR